MQIEPFVLSKSNIYLAIYEAHSYIFEKKLLSIKDRELLNKLTDPFNEKLIQSTIYKVQKKIRNVLNNNKLFDVQVYFKPKKITDNKIEFRPIHTAKLIDMIAMVAMLHALIYEIPQDDDNYRISLSNYSRLIPNNFYGNRISKKPEKLFINWNESYKEYTQKANDYFSTFHKTNEYNYELKLDLKQFFPSVDPAYIYNYLINNSPVTLEDDMDTLKLIIFKLLVCNITNLESYEAQNKYYNDNLKDITFTKGIAQGLPQAYFFGNITMIEIAKIFKKRFEGNAIYYVDDSYVYTNKIKKKKDFKQLIKNLNDEIEKIFTIKKSPISEFQNYCDNYNSFNERIQNSKSPYKVQIHTGEKSSFFDIAKAKNSEIYLHSLSREASGMGIEINNTFSDEEDYTLLNKTRILIQSIDNELQKLKEQDSQKENENQDNKNYKEKLIRYRKFFKYRELRLQIKLEKDVLSKSVTEVLIGKEVNSFFDNNLKGKSRELFLGQIKELMDEIEKSIDKNYKEKLSKITDNLVNNYKDDIWQVAVDICIEYGLIEKEILQKYLSLVIQIFYTSDLNNCSYIKRYYLDYLENQEIDIIPDCYKTLDKLTNSKLRQYAKLNHEMVYTDFIGTKFQNIKKDIFTSFDMFSNDFIDCFKIVDSNTYRLKRLFFNAVYSKIFKLTLSDDFLLNCYDKKGIPYGVLRIMLYLRNPKCDLNNFLSWNIDLTSPENKQKIDYTILEVLQVYQRYVKNIDWIDNLIQVHRYTCDVWKNGAKHLYFYTLHNQEHAIDLIKNIVKIVKAFSYFKISEYDYYLLFVSCYLHDISMVRTASSNDFLLDPSADIITYELSKSWNKSKNITNQKETVVRTYKRLDDFFEKKIRSNHGKDSGGEIRTRNDLMFLEQSVREIVAEISESHTIDARDVYFVKGNAKNKLVSLKFDKILLRLADLLDISENRISRPILNHNMDNISQNSAFHWISHLLTLGYKISSNYKLSNNDNSKNYLEPGSIDEVVTLRIYVSLSQLSKAQNNSCTYMKIDEKTLTNNGFELEVIDKTNGYPPVCQSDKCNFLCRWFNKKNEYMVQEFNALNSYLNRIPEDERFYNTSVRISVEVITPTSLSDDQFDILQNSIFLKT